MRLLALASALALTGCLDTAPPEPPSAADAEALALLAAVDRGAVAAAFARLDGTAYRAEHAAQLLDGDAEVGTETTTLEVAGGERRVVAREATGALADAGPPDEPLRVRDPIASALSDDPPYLDPAARDAYRVAVLGDTTIGGAPFQLVEAVLTDPGRELGVRRVWAAVAEGGRVASVEVERTAASAVYDESSTVRVDLRPGPGGWLPRHVATDTRTDVPLSAPRRLRTSWAVTTAG